VWRKRLFVCEEDLVRELDGIMGRVELKDGVGVI